jgi:hypothetical protein
MYQRKLLCTVRYIMYNVCVLWILHLVLWHFCCCAYLQIFKKRIRRYQHLKVRSSRYFSPQRCRINISKLFLSSSVTKLFSLVVLLSQCTYRPLAVSEMSLKDRNVRVDHVSRLRAGKPKFETWQGQKEILLFSETSVPFLWLTQPPTQLAHRG